MFTDFFFYVVREKFVKCDAVPLISHMLSHTTPRLVVTMLSHMIAFVNNPHGGTRDCSCSWSHKLDFQSAMATASSQIKTFNSDMATERTHTLDAVAHRRVVYRPDIDMQAHDNNNYTLDDAFNALSESQVAIRVAVELSKKRNTLVHASQSHRMCQFVRELLDMRQQVRRGQSGQLFLQSAVENTPFSLKKTVSQLLNLDPESNVLCQDPVKRGPEQQHPSQKYRRREPNQAQECTRNKQARLS